jgi:glycosyltransferase involved in cell wall biosynthesis
VRLLVDLQACQGPSGERGIGYYALALTRALAEHRGEHEVLVLLDGSRPADDVLRLRARLGASVARHEVVVFPGAAAGGQAEAEALREATIAALAPDAVLLTSVFELAEGAPMTVPHGPGAPPTAAMLYDLIPLGNLDEYKAHPDRRREYLAGVEELTRTELLLSISEYSAREARRLLDPCPKVVTVHGAAPPPQAARRPPGAPTGGFGLAVGRDEPRKDVRTAVLAWAALPADIRGSRAFVVAGRWNDETRGAMRREAVAAGLPPSELVFIDAPDDHELTWLYQAADVLIFPSLLEGLGLPPLEAMQLGTPVLMSRSSSLVELLDDERPYFPPGDGAALTALLCQLLTHAELRTSLVQRGHEAADQFTWQRTARRSWDALIELTARTEPGTAGRPSLALVSGPELQRAKALAEQLGQTHEVELIEHTPLAGVHDRVIHAPTVDAWERAAEDWTRTPGVVVVDELPADRSRLCDDLAPAVAVVGSLDQLTTLLACGVTSVPLVPREVALGTAIENAVLSDPAWHWAQAVADRDLIESAGDVLARRPRYAVRPRGRLLASDVTIYRSTPFMSGIQRTTARLHHALTELLTPDGGAVVPVQLGETPPGIPHPDIASDVVLASPTVSPDEPDWILCVDLNGHVMSATCELQEARARGVGVATNVFDLLPWSHPEWWPPGAAEASFIPWVRHALTVSDVLLVNSMSTAQDVESFVRREVVERTDGFEVHLLRLGCDFNEAEAAETAHERDPEHFLMVGTVEPRKGHRAVLDAIERLWAQGATARLTVVGRAGWMVDDLVERMESLTVSQPRFTWLRNASDRDLDRLYKICTAAVVASEGEGFGLPVVEAATRGCPVIVRDIPVLREIAGERATYFGSTGESLDSVLRTVLEHPSNLGEVELAGLSTWSQVGRQLLGVLDGDVEPVARWTPEHGWQWT